MTGGAEAKKKSCEGGRGKGGEIAKGKQGARGLSPENRFAVQRRGSRTGGGGRRGKHGEVPRKERTGGEVRESAREGRERVAKSWKGGRKWEKKEATSSQKRKENMAEKLHEVQEKAFVAENVGGEN